MAGFSTINPKNGSVIKHYDYFTAEQTKAAVADSWQTFVAWSQRPIVERTAVVARLGELLLSHRQRLAELATDEMGKPFVQATAEVEKCAAACRYYADNAAGMLADDAVATEHHKSYVSYQPLGPILAVMPWNFPYWQVIRCAAPALCAGNTLLLKHADNSSGAALALAELVRQAGAPEHAFITLLVDHDGVQPVIADPRVKAVSLTGSERSGSAVAAQAGKHLKKTVLELGGSDPYVVLRDADIAQAAKICASARFNNGGQSCVAAKRFIIEAPVFDAFVAAFLTEAKQLRMGDPRDPKTSLGPLAKASIVEGVDEQVRRSLALGAKAILGGERPSGPGCFYPATVLVDVTPQMPVFEEEVFGPVAPMIKARDEADAMALAGQTSFGLGGAIFSGNRDRAETLARRHLAAGFVVVNGMVVSDPRLPFGGIGKSGHGRELAVYGLREFVNTKTVVVN